MGEQALPYPGVSFYGTQFGQAVACSDDGSVVVVGAGLDPTGSDFVVGPGAVYIYSGPGLSTITKLTASDGVDGDVFGFSVACSSDGSVVVVGAINAVVGGFGGFQSGKAYVYSGPGWSTETILTPSDAFDFEEFGYSVGISADGSTVAVGAVDFSTPNRGEVFIYDGPGWGTETIIVPAVIANHYNFGWSVALSQDGAILAVGSIGYGTPNGGQINVFSGPGWTLEQIVDPGTGGALGVSVSLSRDGSILASAAPFASQAQAYVFSGVGYADATLLGLDLVGLNSFWSVALNPDGTVLAIGMPGYLQGVGGAVIFYGGFGLSKLVVAYTGTAQFDDTGQAVALTTDGLTVVMGSPFWNVGQGAAFIETYTLPGPPARQRFFSAPPWRFITTALDLETLTFLDGRAFNRKVTYTLDQSAVGEMDVPSADPEINILHTDGDPFVAMNNRILFGFRRDGPSSRPWTCRFAGVLAQVNDEVQPGSDVAISHLTAFDPWAYLHSRPVLTDSGLLPGQQGLVVDGATTADQVIVDLLVNAIAGGPSSGITGPDNCFINYLAGVRVTLDPIGDVGRFRQGASVGEAWTQIVEAGLAEIVLDPLYDPRGFYASAGPIALLNIYRIAGSVRNEAVFSWDMPGRSLLGLNRLNDGAAMGNVAQFYAGAAGTPVPRQSDPASIAKYGAYWLQEDWSGGVNSPAGALLMAIVRLALHQRGKKTISMTPSSEFGPRVFDEYFLGDRVPLWATHAFRAPIAPVLNTSGTEWLENTLHRIYAIPIEIPDDAPEIVGDLLMQSPFE